MKEILNRLFFSDTPKFFKRLRALGLSLSAVGTTIVMIDGVPAKVSAIAAQLIWIGAVIAAVSQLTVDNPEDLKK
jgi:hypothetical protein